MKSLRQSKSPRWAKLPRGVKRPKPWHLRKNLVLLVHGFGGKPSDLDFYYDALKSALPADRWQIETVTGLDPSFNTASLDGPDGNTKHIEKFIQERTGRAVADLPDKSVFFVAHSMGGLISRQFSVWHPEKVNQIFMLGTPNGGMNSLGPTSWAGSYQMNKNWLSQCWNCKNKAKPGVEHFVFVGTCSGPPGSPIEGDVNDGLVGDWSVKKITQFKGNASTVVHIYEYNDGHVGGFPATGGCDTSLLGDSRIADRIKEALLGSQ